jgi:hypothetical protein
VTAYPLNSAVIKRDDFLENAQDNWSTLVSGIAPLILLVGERVTKQHLRESFSRFDYYLLCAVPFGLVTSVVSLLRLVSLPVVTRLIGRNGEVLLDTCKEITPINTGNVDSILEEDRVQRGTPGMQQGPTGVSTNAVSRLHFWDFGATVQELTVESQKIRKSLKTMDIAYGHSTESTVPTHNALIVGEFECTRGPSDVVPDVKRIYGLETGNGNLSKITGTMSIKVTAVGGEVNFVKGEVRSETNKVSLVVMSITGMFVLYILSLFGNHWRVTLAWVFLVAGYIGLLISVGIYAEAIKLRIYTTAVQLGPHIPAGKTYCALQDGNLDQEGKTGYQLPISSLGGVDVVKLSVLRKVGFRGQLLGTLAGAAIVVSFPVHYLGLRSVQWWVSISELAICFLVIEIRTIAARTPVIFAKSDSSFDYDLRSIGVVRPENRKRADVTNDDSRPYTEFSCVRLFFGVREMGLKEEGDTVAVLVASKLIKMDATSRQRIFNIIGFQDCQIVKDLNSVDKFVIIHCGGTGLLTPEGFLRPSKPLVWATEFTLGQLVKESLIGWVIHGMNRNEELQLLSQFKDFTSQAVYMPATNSVVDWWLRSEGSNNWEYNVRNLQWSGALALALLLSKVFTEQGLDPDVKAKLKELFHAGGTNPTMTAKSVAEDFGNSLAKLAGAGDKQEGNTEGIPG